MTEAARVLDFNHRPKPPSFADRLNALINDALVAADRARTPRGWADAASEFVGSQKRFSENLTARDFEKGREPGTGRQGFRGLALNDAARRTAYPEIY